MAPPSSRLVRRRADPRELLPPPLPALHRMNPRLWIFTPRGRLTSLPWALGVDMGLVGLQRLTAHQWGEVVILLPIYSDL